MYCGSVEGLSRKSKKIEGEAVLFAAKFMQLKKIAAYIVAQGGGMRMQASSISLMQMPRTTLAVNEVKAADYLI